MQETENAELSKRAVTPYLFPRACAVGLASAVYGSLVFTEVDESGCQTGKVGHVVEEKLGCLVHFFIVTSITNLRA